MKRLKFDLTDKLIMKYLVCFNFVYFVISIRKKLLSQFKRIIFYKHIKGQRISVRSVIINNFKYPKKNYHKLDVTAFQMFLIILRMITGGILFKLLLALSYI